MPRRDTDDGAGRASDLARDVVLRHEYGPGLRWKPGRPRRGGLDLSPACRGRRTRRSTLACVSQRPTIRRRAGSSRARSDRSGAVGQCAGHPDRGECRGAAHRRRQSHERHGAHRGRRGGWTDPARHSHRQQYRRHVVHKGRCDVPWMDEPYRWPRDGRASQPKWGGEGGSWNAAHLSRGCSQAALRASLGDGLFYCFAAD